MSGWLLLLAVTTISTGIVAWIVLRVSFYPVKARRSRFENRVPLEDDLFYDRYYAALGLPKSTVISLRHELGAAFNINASKLLPTDRFLEELSVVRGWEQVDDAPDELFLLNRDREKRLGVTIPLAAFRTADDYIRTIATYETKK